MPMPKTIREKLCEIPGEDGFYNSGCEESYCELAVELIACGFTEDEAVAFLRRVYSATAAEYGE